MKRQNSSFGNNAMLFLVLQVLLIVQRHAVCADKQHHSFQWQGLHPLHHDEQQQHEPNRPHRRRTTGIKGGGHRQLNATTTTSTTTSTTSTVDGTTTIGPYMALKSRPSDDKKSKFKLKKENESSSSVAPRDCGWGRKNVILHTRYDSRNIQESQPNEFMSGISFAFDVISLYGDDGDYNEYYDDSDDSHGSIQTGHWTQTVLNIAENIRIGHDELTFYQTVTDTNADDIATDNSTATDAIMEEHDMPSSSSSSSSMASVVAGVLTTQFDSTRNVAIVTAGSGIFECAQGNPQVSFAEGSTVVTIVWNLCVCETAQMPEIVVDDEEEALAPELGDETNENATTDQGKKDAKGEDAQPPSGPDGNSTAASGGMR